MSSPDLEAAIASVGEVGVHRTFYQWDDLDRELAVIGQALAAGRLPWTSFKPPLDTNAPWADVASGRFDADIVARAEGYDRVGGPLLVTFHHEPEGDDAGSVAEWAAAWTRVHDVTRAARPLERVAMAPILGEWVFNPTNARGDPAPFLTDEVLDRADVLGFDLYQNASGKSFGTRMESVLHWLDSRGASHPVGIGETGCSESFGPPGAAAWWRDAWAWMAANTDRVGVVSYFNSQRNSRADWRLDENDAKRRAFRESLASDRACRL
ncbi:MAG: hypothetical protein ACRD29_21330 [Acidimicrobiales bacterium]